MFCKQQCYCHIHLVVYVHFVFFTIPTVKIKRVTNIGVKN